MPSTWMPCSWSTRAASMEWRPPDMSAMAFRGVATADAETGSDEGAGMGGSGQRQGETMVAQTGSGSQRRPNKNGPLRARWFRSLKDRGVHRGGSGLAESPRTITKPPAAVQRGFPQMDDIGQHYGASHRPPAALAVAWVRIGAPTRRLASSARPETTNNRH